MMERTTTTADAETPPPRPGNGRGGAFPVDDMDAMRPAVEQALQVSVNRDRRILAAALAPVVGGALRRSFWNVFKRAIVQMNRFLVLTFSADGLRWHFEALRTGKPFGTVVRAHSLVEPVTQVFLIHRQTGLLLAQVKRPDHEEQDGDMVSGMLTAIQDFVHDSFHVKADGALEVIRVGDVSVLIEQGPHAILAGIISQGHEPQSLRDTFRRALKRIHVDFALELERFQGEVSDFQPVAAILERCLKQSMIKGEDRISPLIGVLLAAPVLALLVFGGLFVEGTLRWRDYVAALEREPGIVVLRSGWQGGQRYIRGLHDPLAPDPAGLLLEYGFTTGDVRSEWRLYQALDEALLLSRVRRALDPPPAINVAISDGMVVLDGTAPSGWTAAATHRLSALQGLRGVRMQGVREKGVEERQAWTRYLDRLEKTPGVVVLKQEQRDGRFFITGLRDPLAPDPDALLLADGPAPARVDRRWIPYQALDPSLVYTRAMRILEPPSTVTATLQGGVLALSGQASDDWIRQARLTARGLAGVERLDTAHLENMDLQALNDAIPALEQTVLFFLADRQHLWPGQERRFSGFIESARHFLKLARRLDAAYQIEIRGHAPASGDDDMARSASQAIADRFHERLQQAGLEMGAFIRVGMGGVASPAVSANDSRRREPHVSFHVRAGH